MVIGVGVALSTSLAVIDAFVDRRSEFVRTPKFGIAGRKGTWRGKRYGRTAPWGGVGELMLGVYCAITAGLFWRDGQYAVAPFLTLYTVGFFTVGLLTVGQSLTLTGHRRERAVALGFVLVLVIGSTASPVTGTERPPLLPAVGDALVAEGFFPWEARQGKVTFVKLDVADPNDDLGPQVMAFNAASGRVYAMDPPRKVPNLKANFPSGVYQIAVDTANATDILSLPHAPKPPIVIRP